MINNQPQNLKDDLLAMYPLLGEMFSINYSCLRVANQDVPISSPAEVMTATDVSHSKNKLKDAWIELKLGDVATLRNEVFSELEQGWEAEKKQSFSDINFEQTIRARQSALIHLYNDFYGTNERFEDAFDGFCTKNPNFQQIIQDFDTKAVFVTTDEKLSYLLHEYFNYIEILKLYMAFSVFDKISKTLQNDLTKNGRPSVCYGKPESEIITMSGDEIEDFVQDSEKILKQIEREIKTENKKLAPLYKRTKKNFSDYDAHSQVSQIKSIIFNLLEKQKKAKEYNLFAKTLLERLDYANTDYDGSHLINICKNLFDLTTGINIFKKGNRLKFDKVYVHELEKQFLTYMQSLFKNPQKLTHSKTEQNQKI